MYSTIAKHILYPIGEAFLKTNMLKHLKMLEETQWWSPAQLQELQNEKLRALIEHAYKNAPYYRRIFEERGLTDKDIQTVEDLPKLPILTKGDIRQNFDDLKAKDFKRWKPYLNATGGSTGEPLRYYTTVEAISVGWASNFRAWGWAGYKLGDKRATLAGASLIPGNPTLFQRVRSLAERNLRLSAFDMNQQRMSLYLEKLVGFKPIFLRGYPSALYVFANYLQEAGIDIIRPRAVFTDAETLLPQHRQVIERQFGCKVLDGYGCRDGGAAAGECMEHRGYHISVEQVVMEFMKNGKPAAPGESAEIILTDLYNYAMPFIRYAVGDMGAITDEQCSCGRGLPLMKSLQGRIGDFITTPDGKKIHGEFFSHIFWGMTSFMQFQIVQESLDNLVIKVVPYSTADQSKLQEEVQRISEIVRMRTGAMNVNIKFVDEIPTTKAGKWRFIISKITEEAAGLH